MRLGSGLQPSWAMLLGRVDPWVKELAPYLAVGAHLSLISNIFSVLSVYFEKKTRYVHVAREALVGIQSARAGWSTLYMCLDHIATIKRGCPSSRKGSWF